MGIQVLPENLGGPGARFGRGLGKGLAESLPRESERARLASGLKQFAERSQGLSPLQQLSELSAIPGITPQMVQSFGELAKQQTQANALKGRKTTEFPKRNMPNREPTKQGTPSVTTTTPTNYAIEPYIPKNRDQILDRGSQLFNEDPGFYKNDPQNAIDAAIQEDSQEQAISAAQQAKRKSQQDVLSKVQTDLANFKERANVKVPDNVYSQIENEAIRQVRDGEKTEDVAARDARDELDKISRKYQNVANLGNWTLITNSPSSIKTSIKNARTDFKKRNDLENFADTLVGENGLTYDTAYYFAYPVSEFKDINNFINKLPDVADRMQYELFPSDYQREQTEKIVPELAKLMGKEASPLAIGRELESRGYDANIWKDYLEKNKRSLDLSARQERELDKPTTWVPNLNDLWLLYFSGLEKLVEQ